VGDGIGIARLDVGQPFPEAIDHDPQTSGRRSGRVGRPEGVDQEIAGHDVGVVGGQQAQYQTLLTGDRLHVDVVETEGVKRWPPPRSRTPRTCLQRATADRGLPGICGNPAIRVQPAVDHLIWMRTLS